MTQVGDIVLYNHGVHETVMVSDQPLAAIVTYVHAPVDGVSAVNLAVFGKNGDQWQKHSVAVWDGDGDAPEARLAFAYPVHAGHVPYGSPYPPADGGVPADPASDVLHPSTRGPNKLASGVGPSWDGSFEDYPAEGERLVNPPIGPEYKPDAEHPMPNAPEPINKVPADSPANPDRPLD